jgi:hypothetical protein
MLSRLYSFATSRKKAGAARLKKRAVPGARLTFPEAGLLFTGRMCAGALNGSATIIRCLPGEVGAARVFFDT